MGTVKAEKPRWRKWLSRAFVVWGVFVLAYLFSGYRTVDVDPTLLRSDAHVSVRETAETLELTPPAYEKALIFLCGSGVSAEAYVPLLHPLADDGFAVFIVKLPYRFAPFASHRAEVVRRADQIIASHPAVSGWIVGGHSLGGVLACKMARASPDKLAGMVLLGTTHPRDDDLSSLEFPVTKVYASKDGIAPIEKVEANKEKLPASTRFVVIDGGNHVQFGNYARQFLDGSATISRTEQQSIARHELLEMLRNLP